MNYRITADQVKNAVDNFFVANGLTQAVADYFASTIMQQRLADGYEKMLTQLIEAEECVDEALDDLVQEVANKIDMSREDFEKKTLEIFKMRFAEVFLPAAAFINIKPLLLEQMQNPEEDTLILIVEGAMDDISENMCTKFNKLMNLLRYGMPMEMAEKYVNDNIPIVEVHVLGLDEDMDDDGEEDDDDEDADDAAEDHNHTCNGQCGRRCDCEDRAKCNEDGHCQCEESCKCGNSADE